ncbi:hypothetical protein ACFOZ9_03895 [Deinococcus navajonensis]|uniref:Uncharacterized protein n=1 Tax=Deinococcus navajonensis TaxID=309884 RepID=A0ABV8XKW7_9DEIO
MTHLTELYDVFSPEDARQAGAQTRRELHLSADLRRPRPAADWETSAAGLLLQLWHAEGPGLLARLGEAGPWVYAPDVATLQDLGRAYERLVRSVWTAGAPPAAGGSLLERLVSQGGVPVVTTAPLSDQEEAFWALAARVASQRREARTAGVWP